MKAALPLAVLMSALLASLSSPANACRFFEPVQNRIERGYSQGVIEAVARVEIASARHIREAQGDTHPWRATARLLQPVAGNNPPDTVEFERGWGSAACEWSKPPLPQRGDVWIVYFWKDRAGALWPWLAMTDDDARRYDPKMAKAGPARD